VEPERLLLVDVCASWRFDSAGLETARRGAAGDAVLVGLVNVRAGFDQASIAARCFLGSAFRRRAGVRAFIPVSRIVGAQPIRTAL
jgi:hypothetical protein